MKNNKFSRTLIKYKIKIISFMKTVEKTVKI